MRRRFPSVSALEFRCCREFPFVNQMLTFDERISCTRHDDFSPRSHRAVSLQVAPFLGDCKDRGCRRDRRAGQTEWKTSKFFVIWIKLTSNRDFSGEKLLDFKSSIAIWSIPLKGNNRHQYYNGIFRTHSLPSNSINLCFFIISLQCCYHNDIVSVATFSFLRAWRDWWLVGWIFGNLS